jgi:hypothetical protein
VADELAPRGLALVTIMMEGNGASGRRFVDMTGLKAPVVVGTMELAAAWRMQVYPWTVVLGRDGKPLHAIRGGRSEDQLRRTFSEFL